MEKNKRVNIIKCLIKKNWCEKLLNKIKKVM